MDSIPQKNSLVTQTVEILINEINAGTWTEWLPSENSLSKSLHISRGTLRLALAHLKARKITKPVHSVGHRIIKTIKELEPKNGGKGGIGLLSPVPVGDMRPNVANIVDELRGDLAEIGYLLHVHHGEHFSKGSAHAALSKLVQRNSYACWVLMLAEDSVKRWFYENNIHCVVSGSCPPDLPLSFVDIDYRALCRHAVGQIISAGHRNIAFLLEHSTKGGDMDSEQGFVEGIEHSKIPNLIHRIIRYAPSPESISRSLARLFNTPMPPTALIVANPYYYLCVHTWLQSAGLRVPQSVSLISRDDDPFLHFIQPAPSRYGFNASTHAQHIFKLVMGKVHSNDVRNQGIRIIPNAIKGMTLAPPPEEESETSPL